MNWTSKHRSNISRSAVVFRSEEKTLHREFYLFSASLISSSSNFDKTFLCCHLPGNLLSTCPLAIYIICLLNSLFLLLKDQFNMCRLTGILSNTSVSAVSPTTARWGTVALCMADEKLFNIQSLGLSIGNGVGEKVLHNGRSLHGPPSLVSGTLGLLGHGLSADSAGVSGEGNDGLKGKDIIEEFLGLDDGHSLDMVGDFPAVLVVHAEVGPAGLGVGDGSIGFDGVTCHGEGIGIRIFRLSSRVVSLIILR